MMVMKEIESVIQIKKNFRTHLPKPLFDAIDAKPGDWVKIKIWVED